MIVLIKRHNSHLSLVTIQLCAMLKSISMQIDDLAIYPERIDTKGIILSDLVLKESHFLPLLLYSKKKKAWKKRD